MKWLEVGEKEKNEGNMHRSLGSDEGPSVPLANMLVQMMILWVIFTGPHIITEATVD